MKRLPSVILVSAITLKALAFLIAVVWNPLVARAACERVWESADWPYCQYGTASADCSNSCGGGGGPMFIPFNDMTCTCECYCGCS